MPGRPDWRPAAGLIHGDTGGGVRIASAEAGRISAEDTLIGFEPASPPTMGKFNEDVYPVICALPAPSIATPRPVPVATVPR
jgi:hypothetical protein